MAYNHLNENLLSCTAHNAPVMTDMMSKASFPSQGHTCITVRWFVRKIILWKFVCICWNWTSDLRNKLSWPVHFKLWRLDTKYVLNNRIILSTIKCAVFVEFFRSNARISIKRKKCRLLNKPTKSRKLRTDNWYLVKR